MSDRSNLRQFVSTVKDVYQQQRSHGVIPEGDVAVYDQLITCPAVAVEPRSNRAVFAHRHWRRRVARMYFRSQGKPVRGILGFEIEWEDVWQWLADNIVPIMKALLAIVPFLI